MYINFSQFLSHSKRRYVQSKPNHSYRSSRYSTNKTTIAPSAQRGGKSRIGFRGAIKFTVYRK